MKSLRYHIWLDTDNERCGLWPEMFDAEGLTIDRYLERAERIPPYFFMRDGIHLPAERKSFRQYAQDGFEGSVVTVADFVDHLTTLFPEVRSKGYVELRSADALPPKYVTAVAGFWRAILDDEPCRLAVEERLSAIDYPAAKALQPMIAKHAMDADSPAGPVREVVRWLMEAAHQRLLNSAPDCAECLEPLVERAEQGVSFSDDMLLAAESSLEEAVAPFWVA